MAVAKFYMDSDNVLEVADLQDQEAVVFVDSATVTATVVDSDGNPVDGCTWPIPLVYVAGSTGTFRGTMPYTMVTNVGDILTAQITADGGLGLRRYFELPMAVTV